MPSKKLLCFQLFAALFTGNVVFAQPPKLVTPIGHTGEVLSAMYSPNEKKVFTLSTDGTAKLWEVSTGALLTNFKVDGDASMAFANDATFLPGGKYVLVRYGSPGYYRFDIYDLAGTKIWSELYGRTEPNLSDLNADYIMNHFDAKGEQMILFNGSYRDSAFKDAAVVIFKIKKNPVVALHWGKAQVISCIYSQDGKFIITSASDKTIKTWNAATGKMISSYACKTDNAALVQLTPNAKKVLLLEAGVPAMLDLETKNKLTLVSVNKNDATIIYKLSPDGKRVIGLSAPAAGENYVGSDRPFTQNYNTVTVWDAATGNRLFKKINLAVHNDIEQLFSPDGKNIILLSKDKTVKLLNASTGDILFKLTGFKSTVNAARYSKNEKTIVTASDDGSVKLWDAATGKLIKVVCVTNSKINDARFSADGKFILTADGDYGARIWDVNSTKMLSELGSHSIAATDAWLSDDMKKLVVKTPAGIKVLNFETGTMLTDLSGIKSTDTVRSKLHDFLASPDSSLILNWGADLVQAHANPMKEDSTPDFNNLQLWIPPLQCVVNSVRFGADSRKVVLTLQDNTTRIFDYRKGEFISTVILLDSSGYVNEGPGGFYQATPIASKLLHYITPDLKVISFEQLDVKYNRPDKVLQAMGNTDTALISSYRNAYIKRIKKLGIDTTAFRDGYSVPEADFANRDAIELEQKNEKLVLHIKGRDSIYVLDRFNCWVNEVPLFGIRGINIKNRRNNTLDTTIAITLSDGENRIETSVTNVNGTESYHMPLAVNYKPANAAKEKVYFIGIGIDRFADARHNLTYSTKDIRDLCNKLKAKFGNNLVTDTLLNENVTISNVKALKKKLLQTTVNDKVIISYSGHGLLNKAYDYYLSTYTVNFKNPEENGLPYDELESLLDMIPARKKLMLIDACHSGEVDKDEYRAVKINQSKLQVNHIIAKGAEGENTETAGTQKLGLQNSFELMQNLFVNVGKSTGATIISAAGGTEFALENGDLKNGVFTYSVMEAMDKHSTMKISELKKTVGARVEQLTNGMQKPTSRTEAIAVDWNVW